MKHINNQLCVVLVLVAGLAMGQETKAPGPQLSPPTPVFKTASGRSVFLRGECVKLYAEIPLSAQTEAVVTLKPTSAKDSMPVFKGALTPVGGKATLNLLVPTDPLGRGDYTAELSAGTTRVQLAFAVRETTVKSPGMVGDDMCGWTGLAANSRLARQTAYMAFMNGTAFDVTGTTISSKRDDLNRVFDAFADQQVLFWFQDSTRPMSFCPPHSNPDTDGEYLRRLILGETAFMQYPTFAGHLFDYDPTGFQDKYVQLVTYWGWGNLRDDLATYMKSQDAALIQNFKKETSLDAPTSTELLSLAAAIGSPEAMGYIDLPTRRWASQIAARSPAMDPAALESLRKRAFAWYRYLMGLNERRYAAYVKPMKALDHTVALSTANTINHCTPRDGGYHASSYRPLDFRFASVWDDQGGAPEHIYETALAATLLNAERSDKQPLWVNTVFGSLNGHHFRNTLLLVGRGAQGTGYSSEMGGNLGVNARGMLRTNADRNQEVDLNGRLMERLGGLFARVQPMPRVGMLYSARQISMTPYAQSYVDDSFKVMYLLSHSGLTPCLITEEMLANGQVPPSVNAIVVLRQSEDLPEPAEKALRQFAGNGGWVVADSYTTVKWEFLRRCSALDLPFWDMGHPYNMLTAYNRQDASVIEMRALAADRCPKLRSVFQGILRQMPLDCTNPDVGLSELRGGTARFVVVCNDAQVDLSQLFTPAQRRSTAYQSLLVGHGTGALGSWMPLSADLLVSPEITVNAPAVPADRKAVARPSGHIYDLMRGRATVPIRNSGGANYIACDMTDVPGGIYAIYPCWIGAGKATASQTIAAGSPIRLNYQAGSADGTDVAAVVPLEITLRGPDGASRAVYYRATDAKGALTEEIPTGVFDSIGACSVDVRQVLDGAGVRVPVTVKAGKAPAAEEAPAVAVRDPQSIRRFLDSKPEVVVPVFDVAMKPLAEKAVAILNKQGAKARLWENPAVTNYALAYVVKPDQKPDNDKIDRGEAIGRVQFQNMVHHVNGNIYCTALTGYRFGKPVVILGVPGKNAVLDGIRASGLLWTDAATESPRGGLVQRLPWALGRDVDTLVVQGTDMDGLAAAVEALAKLPDGDPATDGVRLARARLMEGRALPRSLEALPAFKGLTAKRAEELKAGEVEMNCSLVSVRQVIEWGDLLVASLGRYGENVVLLGPQGKPTMLPGISTSCEIKAGKTILVTAMPGLACAWNRDGKLLWRARGDLRAILPDNDAVVLEQDKQCFQVLPDGGVSASAWKPPEAKPAELSFTNEVLTEKKGADDIVKGVKVTHKASGEEVKGLVLTTEKLAWNQPNTVVQTLTAGASGNVLLAFTRWVGEPGAQLYTRPAGKVLNLGLATAYLTDVALASNEKRVALAGMEGEVRVFDLDGKPVGSARAGAYPKLFPLADGGWAAGSADGVITRLGADGKVLWTRTLADIPSVGDPDKVYAVHRAAPLIVAPSAAAASQGGIRFEAFYSYLRDDHGEPKMVNWPPANVWHADTPAFDFRWMDVIQGEIQFPETKSYKMTMKAAAKYFDDEPLAQPSWNAILALRKSAVKNERPPPQFVIYVDGKRVGTLTPEGGTLKPFATPPIQEGWAVLKPKDEELTVFQGDLDIRSGPHLFGIEAVNMEDCYVKGMELK